MTNESEFFKAVAGRDIVRVRVAAIVISGGRLLVQRPTDDPDACYSLIGGEYEMGDTFESRIREEFEEETTARVIRSEYRFVVENRYVIEGRLVQWLEHYLEVEIDRQEISSREAHLSQHWLPLEGLGGVDLRPFVVRDVIVSGKFREVRHMVVEV